MRITKLRISFCILILFWSYSPNYSKDSIFLFVNFFLYNVFFFQPSSQTAKNPHALQVATHNDSRQPEAQIPTKSVTHHNHHWVTTETLFNSQLRWPKREKPLSNHQHPTSSNQSQYTRWPTRDRQSRWREKEKSKRKFIHKHWTKLQIIQNY